MQLLGTLPLRPNKYGFTLLERHYSDFEQGVPAELKRYAYNLALRPRLQPFASGAWTPFRRLTFWVPTSLGARHLASAQCVQVRDSPF